ncbi:MAG TPA: DEAD/DEAH box helicase family protein, partial [Ktedonobacterales bacterium]|nr:DEAD/DEAH box helicase family protein [Ktedonobacterales bacterium]
DVAIVDEASQLTVPALLGALRFARRFILVGDERQLPPLVMSEVAAQRGLQRSLFARLLAAHGERASVALRGQYRMHPVICAFPSAAFYRGELVAAGDARTALLDIAPSQASPQWDVLRPDHPLVFVDVPTPSDAAQTSKVSATQALVTLKLVRELLALGVAPEEIGVIAPFRAQVSAIRQRLERLPRYGQLGEARVTVDTVDRFQGGERRVMLMSFGGLARAQTRGLAFLADPNRLNVALTRAQRKLILIGDRAWLRREPLLDALLAACAALYDGRGGVVTARIQD